MKNKIFIIVSILLVIVITIETIHIYKLENKDIICEPKECDNVEENKEEKVASAQYLYKDRINEYNIQYNYYLINEESEPHYYSLVLNISGENDLGTYIVNSIYIDDQSTEEIVDKYIYKYTKEDIIEIQENLIVIGIVNNYYKDNEEEIKKQVVALYKNNANIGYDEVIYTGPIFPPVFIPNDKNHKLYNNNYYVEDNKIYLFKFSNEYYCENGYGADCLYETIIEFDGKDYKEYKGEKVMGIGAGLE